MSKDPPTIIKGNAGRFLPMFQHSTGCVCGSAPGRLKEKAILVTGASGFVGRHFLEAFKDDYHIYALARRCQQAAGVPQHPNIHWLCGDIGDEQAVSRTIDIIKDGGGVDYIFHFAGYYDFTNQDNPEYTRTNVTGTRILLENAKKLNIKRFIFSSSLTVSEYRGPERTITEASPLDADIPYARSKKAAEALLNDYSRSFPCTIVRLAAIYSDWGEYGPLYALLRTWLSRGWLARTVAGRGNTGLPYLHVTDLISLFSKIIRKHDDLASLDIVVASPDGSVSHNELYEVVSKYRGGTKKIIHVPLWLAAVGVFFKETIGGILRRPSFERLWMLKYIDQRMNIDSSGTRKLLEWAPKDRYHIRRRLFFLIDNMISNPTEWESRNQVMAFKAVIKSPNTRMYDIMMLENERFKDELFSFLTASENRDSFPHYHTLDPDVLRLRIDFSFEMLSLAVLSGDRHHIRCYAQQLARQRKQEGVGLDEFTKALRHNALITEARLKNHPDLGGLRQDIEREFSLITLLILDEVEDVYDHG